MNNTIDDKLIGNENNIVFYTDKDDNVNVEVILQNEKICEIRLPKADALW